MKGWWIFLVWGCGCASPDPGLSQKNEIEDPEIRAIWRKLELNDRRSFQETLAYIQVHPELLPYVAEAVRSGGASAREAARILGVLGRPTDIAVLRESVEDSEFAGIASAEALLVMPYPEAHKALWEVISNGKEPGAVSAIEAVRHKKNIESCPAIQNALQAPNKEVRFHALDVAFKLHCIDAKRVADFVNDPDREIAEKAKGFLQP